MLKGENIIWYLILLHALAQANTNLATKNLDLADVITLP
jgi:hypothetical protein